MSRETIGGKTREQWELYILRAKNVTELLLDSMRSANDNGDQLAAEEINKLYDAMLNIVVLAEFVIDNHDWKEKKKKIQ